VTSNLIVFAIPAFFFLIAVEYAVMRLRGRGGYFRLTDAINSMSCGILQQLPEAVIGLGPGMALYAWAGRLAPRALDPASPWTWVIAFVGVDFCYYWWHRSSHRVNVLWAGHVVHHQSEEYNLSTALRQSWITSVTGAFFYLPIAVAGVPFSVYFASVGVNLLYQFWIHTRLIGKLGPFEWIFNTPSHHRVHHGVNPEYLDRNYAGILIIWDRLFGTFEEERAEVLFGTVKPISTWNPVANTLEYFVELARRSREERGGWLARVRHWFVAPDWTPEGPHAVFELSSYRPEGYRKFDTALTTGELGARAALFVAVLVASATFMNFADALSLPARFAFLAVAGGALVAASRGPGARRSGAKPANGEPALSRG
jgi:sterol desaturase/sphingolipid hydroxylase (fatty acid hydroxylase superfamily)